MTIVRFNHRESMLSALTALASAWTASQGPDVVSAKEAHRAACKRHKRTIALLQSGAFSPDVE